MQLSIIECQLQCYSYSATAAMLQLQCYSYSATATVLQLQCCSYSWWESHGRVAFPPASNSIVFCIRYVRSQLSLVAGWLVGKPRASFSQPMMK